VSAAGLILILSGYVCGVILCTGALLAQMQSQFKGDREFTQKHYRSDLSFCVALSIIPLVWILVPFLTGFFEYGWMLTRLTPGRTLKSAYEARSRMRPK
jgi:hypothetical protein